MKNLLTLLAVCLVLSTCGKGPETVTVKSDPSELFEASDSVATVPEGNEADFIHVKLGEIASVGSLDPLYADSYSEFRVLNLMYEGLTRLDEAGRPAPALATRWEVSNDSSRYTFHLKTNVYFHDSPIFGNGNGRRVVAGDVKYIFERMASDRVPAFAGNYFSDIRGFSQYRNELKYVKDPAKQAVDSIEGIAVQNDSTVVFNLVKKAPDFLYRLAHPRASVYAKEGVPQGNGPAQRSAGTGPFYFVKKEGNVHILALNEDYAGEQPDIDRLDIYSGLDEKTLFQDFARRQLDGLVEVGPSTLLTIADSAGNVLKNFYPNYEMLKTQETAEYSLFLNPASGQKAEMYHFLSSLETDTLLARKALGHLTVTSSGDTSATRSVRTQFTVAHTEHPTARYLIGRIAEAAVDQEISFGMIPSFAISDNVALSTRAYEGTEKVLSWYYPVYILTGQRITGAKIMHEAWNLDLSDLKMAEVN